MRWTLLTALGIVVAACQPLPKPADPSVAVDPTGACLTAQTTLEAAHARVVALQLVAEVAEVDDVVHDEMATADDILHKARIVAFLACGPMPDAPPIVPLPPERPETALN